MGSTAEFENSDCILDWTEFYLVANTDSPAHAEFVALLATADISQAGFARLAGVSARQVNKWCRGRAALPRWAALLAIALRELSADALTIILEGLPLASPGTQATTKTASEITYAACAIALT